MTEAFLETSGEAIQKVIIDRTNVRRFEGAKMDDFIETWKIMKSGLADALLQMIANTEESLTGVCESDVLAKLGNVLLAEGCVFEQKRRIMNDLAEAQRVSAEKLANGEINHGNERKMRRADASPRRHIRCRTRASPRVSRIRT